MIICSALCMPKETYHIGNAISSVLADLIANYQYYMCENRITLVASPWNLHGKPYENLYFEKIGQMGTYDEIYNFSKMYAQNAQNEVRLFLDNKNLCFFDTDGDFVKYSIEAFIKLIEKKFILKNKDGWVLDSARLLSNCCLDDLFFSIDVFPNNERKTIISQRNTFDGYYPISKERIYTIRFEYDNDEISINPIFQSLIFTNYLSVQNHQSSVDFFVGGSGFSSHKWHYYRQLISCALTNNKSINSIVFHGTILGDDNRPMSKHSDNCITPHELYQKYDDRIFLRYFLIRSISPNNTKIDINKIFDEYKKVKEKLNYLRGDNLFDLSDKYVSMLEEVERYLGEYKFGVALETFSVFLKRTFFMHSYANTLPFKKSKRIYKIFFGE